MELWRFGVCTGCYGTWNGIYRHARRIWGMAKCLECSVFGRKYVLHVSRSNHRAPLNWRITRCHVIWRGMKKQRARKYLNSSHLVVSLFCNPPRSDFDCQLLFKHLYLLFSSTPSIRHGSSSHTVEAGMHPTPLTLLPALSSTS